jgi:hypothetical protein
MNLVLFEYKCKSFVVFSKVNGLPVPPGNFFRPSQGLREQKDPGLSFYQ